MNITMHMPPCKVEHVTWVLDESVTPLVEVYFTSAPTVFRTVEDLAEVRRVLGEAEAELGAAQARHAAAPLIPAAGLIAYGADVVSISPQDVADALEPLPPLPQRATVVREPLPPREPGDAPGKLIDEQAACPVCHWPLPAHAKSCATIRAESDDAQPQPGGTIYAELSEQALAAHAPLRSLAADPDEEDA